MDLYELSPQDDGGMVLDLTPESISELTGLSLNALSGLLGAGVVGKVSVLQDEDLQWDMHVSDAYEYAIIPTGHTSRHYTVSERIDYSVPEIVKIAGAVEDMVYKYGDYGVKIAQRYAQLFGYEVGEFATGGRSQGDWADFYTVAKVGSESLGYAIDEIRSYWAGEVYGYKLSIESPLGRVYEDACWGYVGEEDIMTAIAAEVKAWVLHIQDDVRKAVA